MDYLLCIANLLGQKLLADKTELVMNCQIHQIFLPLNLVSYDTSSCDFDSDTLMAFGSLQLPQVILIPSGYCVVYSSLSCHSTTVDHSLV